MLDINNYSYIENNNYNNNNDNDNNKNHTNNNNNANSNIIDQNILEIKNENKTRTLNTSENSNIVDFDINRNQSITKVYSNNNTDIKGNNSQIDNSIPSNINSLFPISNYPFDNRTCEYSKYDENIVKSEINARNDTGPSSDYKCNDLSKDIFREQMIQKLEFQQLAQRIYLTYNQYKEYQDLVKQVNDKKQPYHELAEIKEQLLKRQQDQLKIQNKLHSQQRSDLQLYLYYLQ